MCHKLTIAQDPAAGKILSEHPFALLTGMLVDQRRSRPLIALAHAVTRGHGPDERK